MINYTTNQSYDKDYEISIKQNIMVDSQEPDSQYLKDDLSLGAATPILLAGTDSEYSVKPQPHTTKNCEKRFDFDSVRLSENSSIKDGYKLTHPEQRRMTEKPSTVFGLYSRNYEGNRLQTANKSSLNNYNRTIQSLQELKKITSGDTGSSNFEESKPFNDSDSDVEKVYLDLSSPKESSVSTQKSTKASKKIFTLFNQPGVTSNHILKYLKSEISTSESKMKLMKLKDSKNDNWTVLHYASKLGFLSVVSYLVSHSKEVDLDRITKNGQTALHMAIEMLHLNMIKFLIHSGASLNVRDHKGRSPLDMLREYNLTYLSKLTDPDASSEDRCKIKVETRDIDIFDVKEDVVDSMFSNIRNYFDEQLKPKGSPMSSMLEPPSSATDSFSHIEVCDTEYKGSSKHESPSKFELTTTKSSAKKKRLDLKATGKVIKETKREIKSVKVGPRSFSVISLFNMHI